MQKMFKFLCTIFFIIVAGCNGVQYLQNQALDPLVDMHESNLVRISYNITDRLVDNLHIPLNQKQPILVASYVDIKHMEQSSNFGRVMAECISSRLAQKGYAVIEIKLRDSLYIKEKAGEFLLSRKIKDMTATHNAQAVVVGTYARARADIYVSSRVVQSKDGKIISSCDYRLPLTSNLVSMFHSGGLKDLSILENNKKEPAVWFPK